MLDPQGLAALFFQQQPPPSSPVSSWAVDSSLQQQQLEEEGDGEGNDDDPVAPWLEGLDRERKRKQHRWLQSRASSATAAADPAAEESAVVVGLHPSCRGRARQRAWALLHRLPGWTAGDPLVAAAAATAAADAVQGQPGRRMRLLMVATVVGEGEQREGGGGVGWVVPAYLEASYLQGGQPLELSGEDSGVGGGSDSEGRRATSRLLFRPAHCFREQQRGWVFTITGACMLALCVLSSSRIRQMALASDSTSTPYNR